MQLYVGSIECRPAPHHPMFLEIGVGTLLLFTYAADVYAAADHMQTFLAMYPVEQIGAEIEVFHWDAPPDVPAIREKWDAAKSLGFAMLFIASRPGVDDPEVEALLRTLESAGNDGADSGDIASI